VVIAKSQDVSRIERAGRVFDLGGGAREDRWVLFFGVYESETCALDIHCNAMHITAMKLQKELVAASSVPVVLSILKEGDSYGYAIIQRVKELSGGKIEWTDGMLYPVLHWLEDQDLVESRWENSETGRKRKYYALKSEGRKALRQQKEQWALVNSVLNQLWQPHHA
jgi:PadR family transcriptional regulator, regulatory protein PadR